MIKSVKIDGSKLDTPERRIKASKVETEMLFILQSNAFKSALLFMNRDIWLRGESEDSLFKKMSNLDIYNYLMKGKEEWNEREDYTVDILVDDYYARFSSVVAYMTPGKPTIHVNTKYFDSATRKDAGSNFMHEWFHTMGSRHSGSHLSSSLPYFLNWVYETLYDRFFVHGIPDVLESPDSIPNPIPEIPPTTETYRVVCKWFGWRMFIGRKTCYRVYDV